LLLIKLAASVIVNGCRTAVRWSGICSNRLGFAKRRVGAPLDMGVWPGRRDHRRFATPSAPLLRASAPSTDESNWPGTHRTTVSCATPSLTAGS